MSKSTKTPQKPHFMEKVIIGLLVIVLLAVGAWAFQNSKEQKGRIEFQHKQIKTKENELKKLNNNLNKINQDLDKTTKELDNSKNSNAESQKKIEELEKQKLELESKLQARVQAKQKLASAATVSQTASASPQPNLTASKQDLMRQAGIPESDWAYTDYIVSKESSWNSNAVNKSSGAFGLAQCLNKPADSLCYSKNPVDQLKWQKQYVQERYGSYANAHKFWVRNNWY
jgi:hypothetical protein|nr:MAG TPA: Peptidoglycan endopeptidase [Caudoviricetes sp.]